MESELLTQYPELKRLARRIRRSKGEFSLFFVECNLPTLRHELADTLSEQLETPAVQVTLPSLSEHLIQFDQLIAEHIKDEPLDSSVFLFGLENWLPTLSKETLHQTVQQLNWRRSAFARLQRPLVIWLPKYALDLLAEHTPDFYDWYSGVFVFKGGKQSQRLEIKTSLEQLYDNNNQIVMTHGHINNKEVRTWLHTLNSLLSESKDSDSSRIRLLNEIALLYTKLGDLEKALDYLEESLVIIRDVGEKIDQGTVLNNIAQIYSERGEYDEALEYLEESLLAQRATGDEFGEGITLNNISQVYQKKGDMVSALEYGHKSLVFSKTSGTGSEEAVVLSNISKAYRAQGNHDLAIEYIEKSLKIFIEIDDKSNQGVVLNNISQIYQDKGDFEKALGYLERALKLYQESGDKLGESVVLNNIASIALARGDYDASLQLYEESLGIARECEDKPEEGKVLNNIAHIYSSKGQPDKALQYLEQSLKIINETNDKFSESSVFLSIGSNYWDKNDKNKAIYYWFKAHDLAQKADNKAVLESIETIKSRLKLDKKAWEAGGGKIKA